MKVLNKVSGKIGRVYGRNGFKKGSLGCARRCVKVRRKIDSGVNAGKYNYPIWNVNNLEHVQ